MKILFVTQHFYPEQFRINDIFFELVKRGHSVTVLTGLPNYPSGKIPKEYKFFKNRKQVIKGVKILRVPLIARGNNLLKLSLNYLSFAVASSLRSFFIKKDFDIIIGHQTSPITQVLAGVLLKKLTKKPFIIYCFDLWPASLETINLSSNNLIYRFFSKISKWIYKKADYIFISSYSFKKYFNEYHNIYRNLLYFPVYAEDIFENLETVEKNNNSKKFNLLFAGNIGKMQNIDVILKAANILKDNSSIIFHIVGDGSERKNMENLAKNLGLNNVIFYGYHKLKEMKKFYSTADAFIVTLGKNKMISYTLPSKVQSYMAAGKPILGAIDGETNEIINNAKCGLCVSSGDYKGLADNILLLYNTRELCSMYGGNAKRYYNKYFSKRLFFDRLECVLNKIRNKEIIEEC